MSSLTIYAADQSEEPRTFTDADAIQQALDRVGVVFERWSAAEPLAPDADQDSIIAAYRDAVDRLMDKYGFQSVDVVSLTPDHPDKAALRNKFLDEHIHSEFEVRFFVDGQGLFYIHQGDQVYAVLCEQGDLISVPANTRHWFDMGPEPRFTCIRLFTNPEGWVAQYTGDAIAGDFPRLEN